MNGTTNEDGHLLMPNTVQEQISAWHKSRKIFVQVDIDPNHGEIYAVGSRWDYNAEARKKEEVTLYALSKPALVKIGTAAGIIYDGRSSGCVGTPTRDYACYKVVGGVINQDGTLTTYSAMKEIDLTVIEEELRAKAEIQYRQDINSKYDDTKQKAESYGSMAAYVDAKVKPAMIQWRKHKLGRAETGAMERLIRQILPLRQQYTLEELKKPFIIPRIDFSPDLNDPTVRQFVLAARMAGQSQLFGMAQASQLPAYNVTSVPDEEDRSADLPMNSDEDGSEDHPEGAAPHEKTAADVQASVTNPQKAPAAAEASKSSTVNPDAPGKAAQQRLDDLPIANGGSGEPNPWELRCCDCNTEIPQDVYKYSMNYFKRALCRDCQKAERQAEQQGRNSR